MHNSTEKEQYYYHPIDSILESNLTTAPMTKMNLVLESVAVRSVFASIKVNWLWDEEGKHWKR